VTYIGPPVHFSAGSNFAILDLTIHATCPPPPPGAPWYWGSRAGQARGTAAYFQNPSAGGSAHHVFDVAEAVRCAPDEMVTWHAPPNPRSIGYEVCGQSWYTREQWLDDHVWPAVVLMAAQVKADAERYGIPKAKRSAAELVRGLHGVRGHVDVSQAFHQSDHTDPGPGFPWDAFMALLSDQPPTVLEEDPMARIVTEDRKTLYATDGIVAWYVPSPTALVALAKTGVYGPVDGKGWPVITAVPAGTLSTMELVAR
jgi:hypothetical protein